MIIFGTNMRRQEIGAGQFYCPRCRAPQPYQHMRARRYFSLYFIPLIPLGGKTTEYVQCRQCGTQFEMGVLNLQAPTETDRRLQSARADVRSGMPLQMARRKLINAGAPEDDARRIVLRACSVAYRECPACRLTYHESIEKCSSCGGALRPTMDAQI